MLYKSYSDDKDIEAVSRVIKRGTWWIKGKEIEDFEKRIADYVGVKYCVTFNSGTSALFASMLTLNIKNKDVILPSFTYIATADAIKNARGNLVFSDIEKDTYCLDVNKIKITAKTKAIVLMNYMGNIARDVKEIVKLCSKNDIYLIEDSAHALGASRFGKNAGQFGDMAMFSFSFNKIISTGEGGCIVTDSGEFAEKLKLIRSHGQKNNDVHLSGYNLRMSTMTGALGVSQMNKIDKLINKRIQIANTYNEGFKNLPIDIIIPENCRCVYQRYTIKTRSIDERDKLMAYLKTRNIPCVKGYQPIHKFLGFKQNIKLPVTESISERIVTLPFHPLLEKEQLDYIIENIKKFYRERN